MSVNENEKKKLNNIFIFSKMILKNQKKIFFFHQAINHLGIFLLEKSLIHIILFFCTEGVFFGEALFFLKLCVSFVFFFSCYNQRSFIGNSLKNAYSNLNSFKFFYRYQSHFFLSLHALLLAFMYVEFCTEGS